MPAKPKLHHTKFKTADYPRLQLLAKRLTTLNQRVRSSPETGHITVDQLHHIGEARRLAHLYLQYHTSMEPQNITGFAYVALVPLSNSAHLGPIVVDKQSVIRGSGRLLMEFTIARLWQEEDWVTRIDLTTSLERGLIQWYQQFGFEERNTTPLRITRPAPNTHQR